MFELNQNSFNSQTGAHSHVPMFKNQNQNSKSVNENVHSIGSSREDKRSSHEFYIATKNMMVLAEALSKFNNLLCVKLN